MAYAIEHHGIVLDTTDRGGGKTLMALEAARLLGRTPYVVCNRNLVSQWRHTAESMGTLLGAVTHYEALKDTKHVIFSTRTSWPLGCWKIKNRQWQWNLPKGGLLILDEVQKLSGQKSAAARLAKALRTQRTPAIMLSATPFITPLNMRGIGHALAGVPWEWFAWRDWLIQHGCAEDQWGSMSYHDGPAGMATLRAAWDDRITGLRTTDIPDWPGNSIFPVLLDAQPEHSDARDWLMEAIKYAELPIVEYTRKRQLAELEKIPALCELVSQDLQEGKSVFIATAYRDTRDKLAVKLAHRSYAGHGSDEFQIADFQKDRQHLLIGTQSMLGEGINLHDVRGERPRVSYILPHTHPRIWLQALGRINRTGARSPATQFIPYLANHKFENTLRHALEAKIANLTALTDNDLTYGGTPGVVAPSEI